MEGKNSFESEKGPTLDISFSPENEISRVKETIEKLSWYKEHYGDSNARLPEGVGEESSADEIADIVSSEFPEAAYNNFARHIQGEWASISGKIKRLEDMLAFNLLEKYTLRLTRYGSGGSYNSDSGVIVANIEFRTKEKIVGTIIHEIVHIGIEHLIKKYNIGHWYKEHLVDLIFEQYFPGLRKMQKIEEEVSIVDKAFKKHFPDIEAVVREIGAMQHAR